MVLSSKKVSLTSSGCRCLHVCICANLYKALVLRTHMHMKSGTSRLREHITKDRGTFHRRKRLLVGPYSWIMHTCPVVVLGGWCLSP